MSEVNLSAYVANDGDYSYVVFATSWAVARQMAADKMESGIESVVECRHEQRFDQYAPGPVPNKALLAAGWSLPCPGCKRRAEIDTGGFVVDSPECFDHGDAYCSPWCRLNTFADARTFLTVEYEAVARLTARIRALCPDAAIGGDIAEIGPNSAVCATVAVYFDFPGSVTGECMLGTRPGEPEILSIADGDLPAWRAYQDRQSSHATP